MEFIIYYGVALIFGSVSVLFFYTGYKGSGTVDSKPLYYGIGLVFGILSIAMFVKNGVLIEVMLAIILGVPCTWFGISQIVDVFKHNIRIEATLKKITERRGRKGSIYYSLDFVVPEYRTKYHVEHVSSKKRFVEGESYVIFISKKDANAYVHRFSNVLLGLVMTLTGIMFLSMIGVILNLF